MSQILSFVDLVNLAIGTPELGSVNFNALHFFLQSLLEHLQLQDVKKEISKEELDFLKPPTSQPATGVPPESEQLARKSSSIFHQMHERISAIERQLSFLNDAPTTAQLLARTQSAGQPTQDMWQMMQLKKKMEVNEEGMTKVRRPPGWKQGDDFSPSPFPGSWCHASPHFGTEVSRPRHNVHIKR